jgi:hypothetical protein
VVPLPRNGSDTNLPGLVWFRIGRRIKLDQFLGRMGPLHLPTVLLGRISAAGSYLPARSFWPNCLLLLPWRAAASTQRRAAGRLGADLRPLNPDEMVRPNATETESLLGQELPMGLHMERQA